MIEDFLKEKTTNSTNYQPTDGQHLIRQYTYLIHKYLNHNKQLQFLQNHQTKQTVPTGQQYHVNCNLPLTNPDQRPPNAMEQNPNHRQPIPIEHHHHPPPTRASFPQFSNNKNT